MCVHLLTTSAMSSSSTSSFSMRWPDCSDGEARLLLSNLLSRAAARGRTAARTPWRNRPRAGRSRRPARTASSSSFSLPCCWMASFSCCQCVARRSAFLLQVGQLLLESAEPLDRRLVLFLAQRLALDFELHDRGARSRRARPASSRFPCAASTPLRPPGRWPCRAGTDPRCSGSTAPPLRRARSP